MQATTHWPCPVSERLAKQKFSHWGFPVNSNEAEFFLLSCLANRSLTGQHHCFTVAVTTYTHDVGQTWSHYDKLLATRYKSIWLLPDYSSVAFGSAILGKAKSVQLCVSCTEPQQSNYYQPSNYSKITQSYRKLYV